MKTDIFKEHGLRKTDLRLKIWNVFESNKDLVSVIQLKEVLPQNVSLSTIYRALDTFLGKGLIQKVSLQDSNTVYYEKTDHGHCHHLICTNCGKVVHLHECPLDLYEKSIGTHSGFKIETHELNLYGLCPECQEK